MTSSWYQRKINIAETCKRSAMIKFWNEDMPGAIKLYDEALEYHPKDAMCWSIRGNCYKKMKNYAAALADSLKSIELNPKVHELTYQRVIDCYLMYGNIADAKKFLEQFQKNFPFGTNIIAEQIQQLRYLEMCETFVNSSYNENDYSLCSYHIGEALKIATECQRYKEMKDEILKYHKMSLAEESKVQSGSVSVATGITTMYNDMKINSESDVNLQVHGEEQKNKCTDNETKLAMMWE